MQRSALFFKLLVLMGRSFRETCGKIVFGIMFFPFSIMLIIWWVLLESILLVGIWSSRKADCDCYVRFCRLQHRPGMNGRVKNWGLEEEKQFTCSYIIGLFLLEILFNFILKVKTWIVFLIKNDFCSRNTAQKQWDETLVLVLGGITRLLRSFFPFLQGLDNFSVGESSDALNLLFLFLFIWT